MFTGIVSHLGKLIKKNHTKYTFTASINFCRQITKGNSIAINGICLTVLNKPARNSFSVDLMPETVKKTMLATLQPNDLINLELPVSMKSFLSGHFVQGHVDGTGTIKKIRQEGNSRLLTISYPRSLSKYIIEKGAITINGISLTVINVQKNYLTVGIIPYTWKHTMLSKSQEGDHVNIEVDIIGKYLEKLLEERKSL